MRTPLKLAVLLGAIAMSGQVQAAAGNWAASKEVSARLVSAVGGTGDLATVPAGIEIKLDGDWKTYWRSPGDAGLPPTLDWKDSSNFGSATLLYPAPQRITVLGIQTFGYKHNVVLPVDIKVKESGKPLDLKLKLDVLVCAEQCIPKTFNLALAIPAGPAKPDAEAQTLSKSRQMVPGDSRTSGMRIVSADEVSDRGKPALEVKAKSDQPFGKPDVIPEVKPDANLGTPRVLLSDDKRSATFDLPLAHKLPVGAKLTGRDITLTLVDGDRGLEHRTSPIAKAIGAPKP